jgi:hypothetical protein
MTVVSILGYAMGTCVDNPFKWETEISKCPALHRAAAFLTGGIDISSPALRLLDGWYVV